MSTKVGVLQSAVRFKRGDQGERQLLTCAHKLMVLSLAVQIKALIKCELVLMFTFT